MGNNTSSTGEDNGISNQEYYGYRETQAVRDKRDRDEDMMLDYINAQRARIERETRLRLERNNANCQFMNNSS